MYQESRHKIVTVHVMKAYIGSTGAVPLTVNLGNRWGWVVNFTPQPLHPPPTRPVSIKPVLTRSQIYVLQHFKSTVLEMCYSLIHYIKETRTAVSELNMLQVWWPTDHNFIPSRGKRFLSSPKWPDHLWGPPTFLYKWVQGAFTCGPVIKPVTHLQPVLKSRIREAVPPLHL